VLQGYLLGRPMPADDFACRAPLTRTEPEIASVL
jgi:EAL domain-containing protein (putative c-di-GMP-specific phosphodiesterase class I)